MVFCFPSENHDDNTRTNQDPDSSCSLGETKKIQPARYELELGKKNPKAGPGDVGGFFTCKTHLDLQGFKQKTDGDLVGFMEWEFT